MFHALLTTKYKVKTPLNLRAMTCYMPLLHVRGTHDT